MKRMVWPLFLFCCFGAVFDLGLLFFTLAIPGGVACANIFGLSAMAFAAGAICNYFLLPAEKE